MSRKILVEMTEAEAVAFLGGKKGRTAEPEESGNDTSVDDILGGTDEEPSEEITVEMIQAKVKELGAKGKKEAIIKLLAKYKVKSITAIPEAKFADFMTDLGKIK